MTLFDWVYLKVNNFYAKEQGDKSGFSGLFVVALMQFFNIFTLFLVICLLLEKKVPLESWLSVLFIFALIFANGVRYYRIDLAIFRKAWEGFPEKKRRTLSRIVSLYIVGSTFVCLILLIYESTQKY